MFHWFGTVTNTRGDSLEGWQVECVQLSDGQTVVDIYSDENETAISAVSGVANRAVTDANGNYDFFVPSGTYSLRFYDSNGEFQRLQRYLPMYGDVDVETAANVALCQDAETAAVAARDEAEAAAAAASALGTIYADTTAGIAGTSDGDYFFVENADGDLQLYLNDSSTAVAQDFVWIGKTTFDGAIDRVSPLVGSNVPADLSDTILDIRVNNGQPGHDYIPRFIIDQPSSQKRLIMQLYDATIGEPVAYFSLSEASGWDGVTPESFTCHGVVAGSVLNSSSTAKYTGASMTVWFNGSIDHSINFNNISTPATDSALLRINPDRIDSKDQTRRRIIKRDPVRKEVITVAASGGDFTTVQAALASLLRPGTVGRGQFPYTYRCSPSHQIVIKVLDVDHVEEWTENVVDQGGGTMIAQGMLVQMGIVLKLNEGTILHTTGSASPTSGPLFEFGFGGFITGPTSARLEQRGDGYVIHNDANNGVTRKALVGDPYQFFQIVRRIEGVTLWAHDGHDDWIIGRGISNDEHEEFAGNCRRESGSTTTSAMYGCHTSPDNGDGIRAGFIDFSGSSFNDDSGSSPGIAFTTLGSDTAQTVRHMIRLGDARVATVNGTDKYQLIGSQGNATVSSAMVV
jgi:hypothetical protein